MTSQPYPSQGLATMDSDEMRQMRGGAADQGPIICSAVYEFQPRVIPFVHAMSRRFLEWCVPEYRFKELPEFVAQIDDFEKLSAGMKAIQMPDIFELKNGEYHEGDDVCAFTHFILQEDKIGVKLFGETATCEKVLQVILCKLGEIADHPKDWKHYNRGVSEKHFWTCTRQEMPVNLLGFLAAGIQDFIFDDLPGHARNYILNGAEGYSAKDIDVVVHPTAIKLRVHLWDRPSAAQVTMDLSLDHQSHADFPRNVVRAISDLDYDSHSKMVKALVKRITPASKKKAKGEQSLASDSGGAAADGGPTGAPEG